MRIAWNGNPALRPTAPVLVEMIQHAIDDPDTKFDSSDSINMVTPGNAQACKYLQLDVISEVSVPASTGSSEHVKVESQLAVSASEIWLGCQSGIIAVLDTATIATGYPVATISLAEEGAGIINCMTKTDTKVWCGSEKGMVYVLSISKRCFLAKYSVSDCLILSIISYVSSSKAWYIWCGTISGQLLVVSSLDGSVIHSLKFDDFHCAINMAIKDKFDKVFCIFDY